MNPPRRPPAGRGRPDVRPRPLFPPGNPPPRPRPGGVRPDPAGEAARALAARLTRRPTPAATTARPRVEPRTAATLSPSPSPSPPPGRVASAFHVARQPPAGHAATRKRPARIDPRLPVAKQPPGGRAATRKPAPGRGPTGRAAGPTAGSVTRPPPPRPGSGLARRAAPAAGAARRLPLHPPMPRYAPRRPSPRARAHLAAATPPPKLALAGTRESGWVLLAIVTALLIVIGLMMVLSASSVEALRSYGGAWVFFQKQAAWVAVGTVAMVVAALWDYRRWALLAWPLVVASFVLLVAVQIPGVGINVSGSTRWLGFGFFTFQPSEMAKVALLLFVADLLARRADRMHDSRVTLRPVVVVAGALGGLVLLQPDMGTAMVMVLIVLVELFVAGLPLIRMAAVVVTSTVGAVVLALAAGYRRGRVSAFLNPWADVSNTGYQVAQSLVALGTGHLAGVGLGASRAKWGFLPNAHTDFIFAIVGEELGLVGTLLVLGLFAAFAVLGIRVALRAADRFGTLLAAGITAWVVGQALVNMGAVTGMLPVTGVPLPFLSFGGTSLVVSMASVGILLNIARHTVAPAPSASSR